MAKTGKEQLQELEQTGQYVFHGSGEVVDIFEPRQAYNFINEEQVSDDKPGVHASSKVDVAIFMAIINKQNCPKGYHSSFGFIDGALIFKATQETFGQLIDPKGYVYIFNKNDFIGRKGVEYICYNPIKPVRYIEVGMNDMSANVEWVSKII